MSEYWQCTSCGKFNYAGHPDDGCIHCGKLAIPSVCPKCGSTHPLENINILRPDVCTDAWHEQVSTGAETRPEQSLPDGRRPECLPAEMPTAPTPFASVGIPVHGEVDPLDALIAKLRHEADIAFTEEHARGLRRGAAAIESVRATHDALVSRRAMFKEHALTCKECFYLGNSIQTPCARRLELERALANPESGNWLKEKK